jgi:hypothetical protein
VSDVDEREGSRVNLPPGEVGNHERRFGILCVLGYVLLSWAFRFDMPLGEQIASLVYPLDTFSMYAQAQGPRVSHLLVRDARGTVYPVTTFRSFACDEPITAIPTRCSESRPIRYLFEDLARHIESHPGAGAEDVELILRTWSMRSGAPATLAEDCAVSHCRVSR